MRILTGYIVILALHFLFKGVLFQGSVVTKGIVVDNGKFSYGKVTSPNRNIVWYPIAIFKGPITQKEVKTINYKPEELPDTVVIPPGDMYTTTIVETDQYKTVTPWGGYFFHRYREGDSVAVIYDPYLPQEGIIYGFFSFWLTLPAICMIVFLYLLWTGIYFFVTGRYE